MSTSPWARIFGYRNDPEPAKLPVIQLLSRLPLFAELSRRELAAIERILHRREYQRGEAIFRQGERGLGMYIVQQGRVVITSQEESLDLSELTDGDIFGEVALIDQSPRSATAIAKTDCRVFGFFQPDLFDLIARDSRLGIKIVLRIARHVGQRLRQANERLLTVTAERDALQRVVDRDRSEG
jgi:CRP-like cAMP-binding protein